MKLYKIRNWTAHEVIYELKCDSLKKCVESAIKNGISLQNADLRWAKLEGANLQWAKLEGAKFRGAYLQGANLRGAYLRGAYLQDAYLPHFRITPEYGSFYAWKKTTKGVIKIYIPADGKRTNSLIGRKCRASKVKVISGPGCGGKSPTQMHLVYNKGETIHAEKFDDDIRTECANGIHFFMTKKEAEEWE